VVEQVMSIKYVQVDATSIGKLSQRRTERVRSQTIGEQRGTQSVGDWKNRITRVQNGRRCNCSGSQR
jgi:hypothetical protein